MKTYNQVLSEAVELNEIFGLGRRRRSYNERIVDAAKKGPEEAAKESFNITRELMSAVVKSFKAYPRSYFIALGAILADLSQANLTGKSLFGAIISNASGGLATALKAQIPTIAMLAAIGFGGVALFKLLKVLVTKGPQYLEAKLATKDNKTLAYVMKKEFGVDVSTQDVRVGSPGRSKIVDI